jgi:hypothetical protein
VILGSRGFIHSAIGGKGLERQVSSRELEPFGLAACMEKRQWNGVGFRPWFSHKTSG